MQHQTLFVFDIETIPDPLASERLLGQTFENKEMAMNALAVYHSNQSQGKSDFVKLPYHQVVAISFVEAELNADSNRHEAYTLQDIRSGGLVNSNEAELIAGFFQHLAKKKPRLVSFNGRGFDLPVLKYRAMKYGIAVGWFYQVLDKWNHYQSRYSANWHCDLMDVLSDYGASSKIRLDDICTACGLPGKVGIDGSGVKEKFLAGELSAIRDYCETDVMNTYLVYLRHMLHMGVLQLDDYQHATRDVVAFLEANEEKKHLKEFLESWKDSDAHYNGIKAFT